MVSFKTHVIRQDAKEKNNALFLPNGAVFMDLRFSSGLYEIREGKLPIYMPKFNILMKAGSRKHVMSRI